MSYASEVLADSPVLYSRFGEPSGTNANDETANNNDGTYTNGPTLGAAGALYGDANTAVTFDGTNDYVTFPHIASYDILGDITLEAWVNPSSNVGRRSIINRYDNGAGSGRTFGIIVEDGVPKYWFGTGSVGQEFNCSNSVSTGVWTHLALTKSGTTCTWYINGAPINSATKTGTPPTKSIPIVMGADGTGGGGGSRFVGTIDEPAVYAAALSAARVLAHYNAGRAPLALTKSLSDSVSPSDAPAKGATHPLSDTASLAEASAKAPRRPLSDSATVTDGRSSIIGRRPADSVTPSDGQAKSVSHLLTDSPTVTEAAGKAVARPLADSVGPTDSLSRGPGKGQAEALGLADSLSRHPGLGLDAALILADAVRESYGLVVGDTTSLDDELVHAWASLVSLAEVASLGDEIRKAAGLPVADSVSIADLPAREWAADLVVGDLVEVEDSLSKRPGLSLDDAAALVGAIAKSAGHKQADQITLTDLMGSGFVFHLSFAEIVSVLDALRRQVSGATVGRGDVGSTGRADSGANGKADRGAVA